MTLERRYLAWLSAGTLVLLWSIEFMNWLVNPFSIFSGPSIRGFNANKPGYVEHLRLTHVYKVNQLAPRCILIGTSRTGRGLSPASPALAGRDCYNLALPAISMYEIRRYLQHARSVRSLELNVISLDFRVFNTHADTSGAFTEERLNVNESGQRQFNLFSSRLPDLGSSLVSIPALMASATTLRKQNWTKDTLARDGFWKPLTQVYDHQSAFSQYTLNSAQRFAEARDDALTYRANLEQLRYLLREAYDADAEVRLLIPPSHAWHWETLWQSGLWSRFEQMKRDISRVNAEEALKAGRAQFPVWDFSGSYGPALEPMPESANARMRWFWEPVHFKRSLGDLVLKKALSPHERSTEFPDFGVQITAGNIELHLANLRRIQSAYESDHPTDIDRIKELVAQANP